MTDVVINPVIVRLDWALVDCRLAVRLAMTDSALVSEKCRSGFMPRSENFAA